jgi:LemA protein
LQPDRHASRLYPETQRRRKRRIPLGRSLHAWASMNVRKLVFFGGLFLAWLVAHVHWYNKLTDYEYNIQMSWAQVEAEQERRYHIQQDLARLVLGYARHERDLMVELTALRTDARGAVAGAMGGRSDATEPEDDAASLDGLPPGELDRIFPQIMIAAEQYPNLRLTENFQQFSTAIIETETRITEHIQTYNERVNSYTTILKQFPGNLFGAVWGFETYEFYAPEREDLEFHPVDYPGEHRGRSAKRKKGVARDSDNTTRR